jgi:hypothetical protein
MTLLEVQRQMLRAISRPFIGSDPIFCDADADFIKPNSRLSPAERLEIYGRSYWFRVLDALYEDFPGLNAVLGPNVFNRLSRAYLSDCTSQSFTLRNLGSRLADWLARNPKYAGNRHAIALDMARLEWAHIEAFDNAGKRVFGPEDLTELGPDFRAVLQPHVRLLALRYLVDDLRIQVNERRITRIQASRLRRSRLFVAVYRLNDSVYYRRLEPREHRLLGAIGEGYSIEAAIRRAFSNGSASPGQQQSMLERWFAVWAQLGWLCAEGDAVEEVH